MIRQDNIKTAKLFNPNNPLTILNNFLFSQTNQII